MADTRSVPLFGAPSPDEGYDRENEAQFRRSVEQYLFELRAVVLDLSTETAAATSTVSAIGPIAYHHRLRFRR